MLFAGGLLAGGLLYSGMRIRQKRIRKIGAALQRKKSTLTKNGDLSTDDPGNSGDENYPIATASLGFAVAGRFLYAPLTLFSVAGMAYLLWPTFKRAYHDLVHRRRFTIFALEAVVLPMTMLAGQVLAAAVAFWFLYFTLNIIAKAKWNANKNLASVFLAPSNQVVYVLREGVEVEMVVKDLQIGDVLVIGAGEIIPVDGTVVQGQASIDQHMLTGESQPVEKAVNDPVFAATLLLVGDIQVRVDRAGEETLANQNIRILNEMTRYTETLELRGTEAADRLALPLFMTGSVTGALMGASRGLAIAWIPLIDTLYAAGPMSVLNFLNIALRQGILVKDGRALEVLRRVDTIVFDKTGTLTKDKPQVVDIHTCGILTQNDILRYAAAAEQKQAHPVALAILEAASAKQLELPAVRSETYRKGYGLSVTIDGRRVSIGSLRLMQQQSLALPETLQDVERASHALGYSLIYVAIDDTIVGAIELHAAVRAETAATVAKLHQLGYQVCIISGDHEGPTRHLAQQLGIDRYFAETLPQDKGELIRTMQQEGRVVCYVGDGINDTIALKQAEVSVSLRGASTIATDTAQIILMKEDLNQLLDLTALAKELEKTFQSASLLSAVPSVGIVVGVLFFQMTLATAIAGYLVGMGLSVSRVMLPVWRNGKAQGQQAGGRRTQAQSALPLAPSAPPPRQLRHGD